MYTEPGFDTKKALREAIAKNIRIEVVSPGVFPAPKNGPTTVEGPSFKHHTWYARVEVKDGIITRLIN